MKVKVSEILKWILIVALSVLIMFLLKTNREIESSYESYKKDGTYMNTYNSKTISQLKKTNRELYDSLKNKKDVKQGIIIKYKYIYDGDTTYIKRKLNNISDSVYSVRNGNLNLLRDTTYTFNGGDKDSVSYTLKINSKTTPNWYKINFNINDKLTIINREKNGKNELSITTNGGIIDDADVFNKKDNKDSFINRFSIGVQCGVGYGLISKKPDVYIGIGIGFRLNKLK